MCVHVCTHVCIHVYTAALMSHVFTFDNGESYAFDTARVIVI